MTTSVLPVSAFFDRIKPKRKIHGITAVLLPFDVAGNPDLKEFEAHLRRTIEAGLEPAVNMDTGFGPQLSPDQRRQVLRLTREVVGAGGSFVAGALPFGESSDLLDGYKKSIAAILEVGATPIVFQSEYFTGKNAKEVELSYRRILEGVPRALGFELGTMFAPFGRIYDIDTFKRLLDIPNLVGAKHSSLSRALELQRLELRDQLRPDFKVFTGNDLAIDMVMYGSDYLLGLSTFDPAAFALRDRWWAEGDARFFELNDALQVLGQIAFRAPVPAYKDSAAVYLKLTGMMRDPLPHPSCPRRPAWEAEILAPVRDLIAKAMGEVKTARAG